MQFEPDPDAAQLRDSLHRLLEREAPFARRREAMAQPQGWDRRLWSALGGLGATALALPEAHGGFGQRPIAALPVLQALGHALALQPWLPTAVLCASALAAGGSAAQQQALLPAIAAATQVLAFAHEEAAARHAPLWVETRACAHGDAWRLDGCKPGVAYADGADLLLVSARLAGAPDEPAGLGLFLVEPGQAGVRRQPGRLIDDTPVASLTLQGARAHCLGATPGVAPLQRALQAGLAAACAEALGVAERAHALTLDYVRMRQQFGRPLAANQAVRHRVAEMQVALETLRSAAMAGLLALELDDGAERQRELARAKMLVSRHGSFVVQQAVQLHGGIGMTLEYPVGHCLRRLTVLDQWFGDGTTHAARHGAALAA